MGQQQLLLLVLSTVIVGLATVAGIQAFSENQEQATQDALVQRGTTIMSDIKGAAAKPSQLGGVDLSSEKADAVLDNLGYDHSSTSDGATVDVDGAAGDASCEVSTGASGDALDSSGSSGVAEASCDAPDASQTIHVYLDGNGDINTQFGSF
jgi:hypothetical protein